MDVSLAIKRNELSMQTWMNLNNTVPNGRERHENILQGLSRWSGGENSRSQCRGTSLISGSGTKIHAHELAQNQKQKWRGRQHSTVAQRAQKPLPAVQSDRRSSSLAEPGHSSGKHCAPQRPGCRGRLTAGACTGVIYQDYQPRCALNYDPRTSLSGPVAKTPSSQYRGHGFNPDWELRSRMLYGEASKKQ